LIRRQSEQQADGEEGKARTNAENPSQALPRLDLGQKNVLSSSSDESLSIWRDKNGPLGVEGRDQVRRSVAVQIIVRRKWARR
jgi:hypothetical protein